MNKLFDLVMSSDDTGLDLYLEDTSTPQIRADIMEIMSARIDSAVVDSLRAQAIESHESLLSQLDSLVPEKTRESSSTTLPELVQCLQDIVRVQGTLRVDDIPRCYAFMGKLQSFAPGAEAARSTLKLVISRAASEDHFQLDRDARLLKYII